MKHNETREDAPDNHVLLVASSKPSETGQCLCTKCFYCKRGSFGKITLAEFLKVIYKVEALKLKFLASLCPAKMLGETL